MISRLKLDPNKKMGRVKLLEHPASPDSPVRMVNILHPTASSV
jgi:hypothetical protein